MQYHEYIYLQVEDEEGNPIDPLEEPGWTWCQDRINQSDVEYVKANLVEHWKELSQKREKHWQEIAGKLASIANSLDCICCDDRNLDENELEEVRHYREIIMQYLDFNE